MCEVVLESCIIGNVIEQICLQNVVEFGFCEGEWCFVNILCLLEFGIGCMVDNVVCFCLLDFVVLNLKLVDIYQNLVGVLKGIVNIWMSYCGSDISSVIIVGMFYSVQWNNLFIFLGGQVNEVESFEYGNLMCGIGIFYYEINSVVCNQINSEIVLQIVFVCFYIN